MKYQRAIDTSSYEDNKDTPQFIDWDKPKTLNIDLIINRATDFNWIDRIFKRSWEMQKGKYIRSAFGFWDYTALDRYNTKQQAQLLVDALKHDPGEFPIVWMDMEQPNSNWPLLPPRNKLIGYVDQYLKTIEDGLGMESGIYTRGSHILYNLGIFSRSGNKYVCTTSIPKSITDKPLWIAALPDVPEGETLDGFIERVNWQPNLYGQWDHWTIWQNTFKGDGRLYGMEADGLDLDYFNTPVLGDLYQFCQLKLEEKPEEPPIVIPDPKPPTNEGETKTNMWESNAIIVAFNQTGSYPLPTTIDFKALKEAGVHAVLLRAGTSDNKLNYDEPSAGFINDPNYRAWFNQAKAAGLRILIDYDFNAMLDSVNGYNAKWTLQHLNYLISGGFKPAQGGALILNCERNTWKQSIQDITCVSSMYGQDLRNAIDAIWNAHKLVPGVRTGRWFWKSKDESHIAIEPNIAFLDKGAAQMPLFLARWKKNNVLVTGDFHEVIQDVQSPDVTMVQDPNFPNDPTKKVTEQSLYLYFGNNTKWSGWEIATVQHKAVKDSKGGTPTFRMMVWDGTPQDFDKYFNFPAASVPEEPEDPADPEEPKEPVDMSGYVKVEEFNALKVEMNTKLAELSANYKKEIALLVSNLQKALSGYR
jgi:hypothetical protein